MLSFDIRSLETKAVHVDGSIRPVRGTLAMAESAERAGRTGRIDRVGR